MPGPGLAAVVEGVAGPEWRCPGAEPDELTGVLRQVAAVESWASSAKLAVIRELIRQDDLAALGRPRHGNLPDAWSESLNHELALALACSVPSAQQTALTAWELGARLPGIAALLADGTLTYAKARLITETFQLLSDADAATAEALILPRLAGKTYGQIVNLANRAAAQVDPGLAERRRKGAVKYFSRVRVFREQSGAAALCGRELPPDEVLAADASVTARALEYRESGAFPGARMDQFRSAAYLDLITGRTTDARVALGYLSTDPPDPDTAPESATFSAHLGDDGDCPGSDPGDGGPGGPVPPGGSGNDGPDDDGPGGAAPPGGNGSCDGGSGGGGRGEPGGTGGATRPDDGSGASGPGLGGCGAGGPVPCAFRGQPGGRPVLADLVVPLATLLGLAERPGEAHRLGVLDPGLCRDLAALAAASPHTQLCITVTDPSGTAIGHGCGRLGKLNGRSRGQVPAGAPPPPVALPARVNLTVTAGRLSALLTDMSVSPGKSGPRTATGWALTWAGRASPPGASGSPGDPDWCGAWTLTLPGGIDLAVRIEPVPVHSCDHRYESHGYQPNETLRHLVQVRDYLCTFPSCSRHARESDFEHAQPYHKGGRTCSCNAGARSRKCHRVKQSPGWNVTQPKPGWHQWTTPSGRTYTQAPYQYPV